PQASALYLATSVIHMAMAPSKLALLLAMNLVLLVAVHGCGSCGNTPPVPVPSPPIAVPPPAPVPSPPSPPSGGGGTCSIDTLKLKVCANVLNLLKLNLGVPTNEQCCPLLSGLADLDAAVCLCAPPSRPTSSASSSTCPSTSCSFSTSAARPAPLTSPAPADLYHKPCHLDLHRQRHRRTRNYHIFWDTHAPIYFLLFQFMYMSVACMHGLPRSCMHA
uniref:Hydrophobic seed protein domain-containing protein n=1 Tax=Aegilops tauschii subsp. strangulata TaxID=200361 RepID=A0A453J9R2_AEGTS